MLLRVVASACLLVGCVAAQSPVTITVDTKAPGPAIAADFAGLSFETSNLLPQRNGEHLFSPANRELAAIFRVLGIRSLRMGGSTADMPKYAIPGESDVDQLFAFAAAAGVKVIYTLRLPAADAARNAAIARYIVERYGAQLTCFEIGNEPDYYRRIYRNIPDYETYRGYWKQIADAVSKATPGARFCGPAAGGTTAWSRRMAEDFGGSGRMAAQATVVHDRSERTAQLSAIVMHEYPGGDGNLTSGAPARDALLSRAWLEFYDRLYISFAAAAQAHHLPYRLEETNNFTGGAKDASDTFTAALWALDYLHWWAVRGAAGMNLHNRRWILNTTIYPASNSDDGIHSGYRLHPIAYGIKAFDLGGHGTVLPVTIANPEAVNLTVYAVRDGRELYITVVNKKDPGQDGRDVSIRIEGCGPVRQAAAMLLTSPNHDPGAKEGITLGGAAILGGDWEGKWTAVAPGTITIPGTSAAVIKLTL
jgi:hypothetical protein